MKRFFAILTILFLTGNLWAGDLFDDETIEFLEQLDTDTLNLMPIQENITANNLPPRLRDEYGFSDSWWQRTSYKVWLFGGRVADRLTPGAISHNPAYNEARARLAGKESGFMTRRMVKLVTHRDRLVN